MKRKPYKPSKPEVQAIMRATMRDYLNSEEYIALRTPVGPVVGGIGKMKRRQAPEGNDL